MLSGAASGLANLPATVKAFAQHPLERTKDVAAEAAKQGREYVGSRYYSRGDDPATVLSRTLNTFYTDPVGAALDVSSVAGGAEGVARLAGATRTAGALGAMAEATNPMSLPARAIAWPVRAAGRRLVASSVGTAADAALKAKRAAIMDPLNTALSQAEAAVRGTKAGTLRAAHQAKEAARTAQEAVGTTTATTEAATTQAAAKWPGGQAPTATAPPAAVGAAGEPVDLAGRSLGGYAGPERRTAAQPPPSGVERRTAAGQVNAGFGATQFRKATGGGAATPPPPHPGPEAYAGAGQAAAEVIQGPAQHSLDQLGRAVEESAKTGPEVDFRPIKAKLEAMAEKARPSTLGGEPTPGQEYVQAATAGKPQAADRIAAAFKDAGVAMEDTHPLPGVLRQIQEAPDTVSFEDAHRYKRLLDDATNWNSPAKGQLKQITKGIRGALRGALSTHAPYNEATAAYQQAAPLFSRGYAQKITKSVVDNPEAVAKIVKPDEPTKLQMLHDVLTTHAAAGGGAAEGQAAWNGVRSALVWKNLIEPGIEKFDQSLAKFHPDSLALLTQDADGAAVIGNLKQISSAYQQTLAQSEQAVAAAKATAQRASATAARTSEQGTAARAATGTTRDIAAQQVKAGKVPTPEEKAFKATGLATAAPPSELAASAATMLGTTLVAEHFGGPLGAFGGASLTWVMRHQAIVRLLKSPAMKDLVQWSSYSSPRTKALVETLSSQVPERGVGQLLRAAGLTANVTGQPAATPPPGPGR